MKRLQSLILIILSVSFITACQSSDANKAPVWYYNQNNAVAKKSPNNLAENFNSENAQAQNSVQDNENSQLSAYQNNAGLNDTNTSQQHPPQFQKGAQYAQPVRHNLPPVKVALLVPLTGKNENLGQSLLNSAQLALFDIGHTGFELLPYDTQGTPQGARQAAQSAVQNDAELILGPIFASSVRSAKNITQAAGVNMIAFSTDWTLADRSTFIMGFLPFDQVNRVIEYASLRGVQNIGTLIPRGTYGNAVFSAYKNTALINGIHTVDTERFAANLSNLSYTVEKFSKWRSRNEGEIPAPYDAIFMPVGGENALSIGNFSSQFGMPPEQVRRLGTGLMDDANLATDPALQGTWFAAPSPDSRDRFNRQYYETYGISPPRLATLSYDATALAAVLARTGLEKSGRPAFDALSIRNPNGFSGIDGIFRFRQNGLIERGLAVLEYDEGLIKIIDPAPQTFQNSRF